MAALVSIFEFERRHGPLSATDHEKVEGFLEDASELLREVGDDTWTVDTAPARVQSVCLWVAYRAFSNPDALSQTSIGDVALSYTRGGTPDAVFLTKSEFESVTQASGGSSFVAATLVSPYSGDE